MIKCGETRVLEERTNRDDGGEIRVFESDKFEIRVLDCSCRRRKRRTENVVGVVNHMSFFFA